MRGREILVSGWFAGELLDPGPGTPGASGLGALCTIKVGSPACLNPCALSERLSIAVVPDAAGWWRPPEFGTLGL